MMTISSGISVVVKKVITPLQIEVSPQFLAVTAPMAASFRCQVLSGGPITSITWSRLDGDMPSNVREIGDGTLEISETSCEASGVYVCSVETESKQERQAAANLSVSGKYELVGWPTFVRFNPSS